LLRGQKLTPGWAGWEGRWLNQRKKTPKTQLLSKQANEMSNNTFTFNFGGVRSKVALLDDGSCLELRRGDITWSRVFKKAHPEVQQCRWSSMTAWWASLPIEMAEVEAWHAMGPWTGPSPAVENHTMYGLSTHLAYFLRRDVASRWQLLEGLRSYLEFVAPGRTPLLVPAKTDPVLSFFFPELEWVSASTVCVDTLFELGHIIPLEDDRYHILEWPSVTAFNLSGLRPIVSDLAAELEFNHKMTYFMGGWIRGLWSDVQRVYDAYAAFHGLKAQQQGSIATDTFLRHILQTKEPEIPWSTFRRLLIERGLIWKSVSVEEMPELLVEPVEVERPVERRLSFGSAPMEIDDDDEVEVEVEVKKPTEVEMTSFLDRVAEQADDKARWTELNALWSRVIEETEDNSPCTVFHHLLMEEYVHICLHERYAGLWRRDTFHRIVMRASLLQWLGDHGENAAVQRFLDTYPSVLEEA
jgi:hypothetical protein